MNAIGSDDQPQPKPRVLLFFDYACSFCYIDTYRFDRLKTEQDVEVVEIPFELRRDVPDTGVSAQAEGLAHSERVEAHLASLAAEEGVPYHTVDLLPNTHKAMVMAEAARDAGMHAAVHRAIFRAYFGDGLDIGDETVLRQVADTAGLDTTAVVDAWESGLYEERLNAFHQLGLDLGISATPAALICNELVIGIRPYGVIRDAVERCLITPANIEESTGSGDSEAVSSSG